jgi:hypothetical protein
MRRLGALVTSAGALAALAGALSGCDTHPGPPAAGPSEPSPNASILPAPLATGPDIERATAADGGPGDAGLDAEAAPPPAPAREDTPLDADDEELRDPSGVKLHARFRWPDVPVPPRLPETNADVLERARSASSFDVDVTAAAAGRLRVVLGSRFVLPAGSELRARSATYGHVLLWPDGSRYAVVQPGALRNLLNERRADVVPLAHLAGTPRGTSIALGFPGEKTAFVTALARVELEQAHVSASGAGAALLCRFVLELAGVHPDSAACRSDFVPTRAEYAWTEGGRLVFEVTALERASTLESTSLRAPPPTAAHLIGEVPLPPPALFADRTQLRSLRLRPTATRAAKDAPKEGLSLANGDDVIRYALVDGLPVARLEPKSPPLLLDLLAGSYALSARTFLGDDVAAAAVVGVPGRFVAADAPRPEP